MGEAKGLIITAAVTLLILIGGVILLSKGGTAKPTPVDSSFLVKSDSHQTNPGAKVTVVEFGDYECPACGAAYPITKQVLSTYGSQINFVFRNFPLPQHKNAPMAAEAAEAANAQGKFWEMHDKLYDTQNDWADLDNPFNTFVGYAKDLGLNTDQFKSDVQGNKYANVISTDTNDGNAIGINATPTFYVNGIALSGVPSFDDFKSAIDPLLK
ncbi:MAG TPA: thioredoxin domain-containing protein [Patescibacteria group bacterium]|nr:thioredoxin domain-containing protein [Patescibacteria group bacterium]